MSASNFLARGFAPPPSWVPACQPAVPRSPEDPNAGLSGWRRRMTAGHLFNAEDPGRVEGRPRGRGFRAGWISRRGHSPPRPVWDLPGQALQGTQIQTPAGGGGRGAHGQKCWALAKILLSPKASEAQKSHFLGNFCPRSGRYRPPHPEG